MKHDDCNPSDPIPPPRAGVSGCVGDAPPGAWLIVRSLYDTVTVNITDEWAGAVSIVLPYQQYVRLCVVGPGLITAIEWSQQVGGI